MSPRDAARRAMPPAFHTPCFESNRGANKKLDRRPESLGNDLFTEHPAIAIYFIDCHLPWLLSLSTFRIKQSQVKEKIATKSYVYMYNRYIHSLSGTSSKDTII